MDPSPDIDAQWPDAIHAHFCRAHVRQVGYVPDAGHSRLIQRCIDDAQIADVVNYVRGHFGNAYKAEVTAKQIALLPHPAAELIGPQ